jgi:hypothetical protein
LRGTFVPKYFACPQNSKLIPTKNWHPLTLALTKELAPTEERLFMIAGAAA